MTDLNLHPDPKALALTRLSYIKAKQKKDADELREAVREAREEGVTWEQIGEALGTSRQSAHDTYGGTK